MSEADLNGSDTHEGIKEQDEDSLTDGDTAAPSINRFAILSEDQQTKDVASDDDKGDVYDEGEDDLVIEMENVTLDHAFIEDPDALEHPPTTEDEKKEVKEYTVVNQDPKLAFHTLGTRTAPERQECSVQSCLFRFTEVETLTQNNSLLCVACTQQQPKKDKGWTHFLQRDIADNYCVFPEVSLDFFFFFACLFVLDSKNVYTDALKQMLVSSPPPVLTLHLKRFQQVRFMHIRYNTVLVYLAMITR